MRDDSFIIPQFKPLDYSTGEAADEAFFESPNMVKAIRGDGNLTYNHYIDCTPRADKQQLQEGESQYHMNIP